MGWVIKATPRPFYPGAGWAPEPVWSGAENLAPSPGLYKTAYYVCIHKIAAATLIIDINVILHRRIRYKQQGLHPYGSEMSRLRFCLFACLCTCTWARCKQRHVTEF